MNKNKDMKALTLKQPWLYTITDLDKWVENRTWPIPNKFLGEWVALHAGKTVDQREWAHAESIHGQPITKDVPIGAVVAVVTFTHTVTRSQQLTGIKRKWFFGPYGWVIGRKFVLDYPIPCRGMLKLWQLPEEIKVEILRQMEDRQIDGYLYATAEEKEQQEKWSQEPEKKS